MQSEEERGVRMKSVGLLAVGYLDLHLHQDFLQRQARFDFPEISLLVLYIVHVLEYCSVSLSLSLQDTGGDTRELWVSRGIFHTLPVSTPFQFSLETTPQWQSRRQLNPAIAHCNL